MKLTKLLLVMALALVCSDAWSQITLKEKKAPLEKVLADIEKQTKYVFLYDPDELKMGAITVEVKNASLPETLEKIFKGLPIEFTVVGNNVLLKKKPPENVKVISDILIHGKVVDSTGQSLPGVTVLNKRVKRGTETDTSGSYVLHGAKGDVLRFSFVGYEDREVAVGDQPVVDMTLEVNSASRDEVVVIGYGSSKKKDLTGAISVVALQDMSEVPYNTFDNALAGKVAGVDVTKTDGTPGGMVRIRIRGSSSLLGSNDPLYVIDGVPVQVRNNFISPGYGVASPAADLGNGSGGEGNALSGSFVNSLNPLGGLNPNDIASITVLKDASSTAIYGSKAANGVVIVTTKSGNSNAPARVTLDYSTTVASAYKTPKLLNPSQYKTLLTEAAQNGYVLDSVFGSYVYPEIPAILDSPGFFGNANTNWIKTVTRTAVSQNVGLSVSGGGHASKYFTSLAYNNTPGVIDGTDFRRISGKMNLETQLAPGFQFAVNLLLGYTDQNIGDGAYTQALLARPDMPVRDATGNYTESTDPIASPLGIINPAALLTATNNGKTTTLLGSVSGTYSIVQELRLKSTVSLNMQDYNQRNFLPSYIDVDRTNGDAPNTGGIGSNANSRFADWFLENTLSYAKQFGQNAVNAVIGQSYETTKYSYFQATASGYPNNTTLTGLSSASTPLTTTGEEPSGPQSYLLSFYARMNYNYQDKYMFTFTGRTDGSSKFGPDNKYGYFPSGAVGWRISQEKFLKNVGWINDLKLRGSYGLTGNQDIGDQMYRTLYTSATYNGSSALIPTQLGNQGIKWETTKEADAGLDLSLLADRLNATFDYYNRQTNDDLLWNPIAASSSYTELLENVVGLRNRGFEASVGGDIIRSKNIKWAASVNITWNSSLVTRLSGLAESYQIAGPSGFELVGDSLNSYGGNTTITQGKPLGLMEGTIITGLIKTQAQLDAYNNQLGSNAQYYGAGQIGAPMYKLNAGTASQGYEELAPEIIGQGQPKYFGGMTQELRFKRFDLQCYFSFSHGGHLLWVEHVASMQFYGTNNADRLMLNRYTPENSNSNQPRLSWSPFNGPQTNLDVFSSSYFKLRSLTLNYQLNVKKTSISKAEVFVSATNVFTITKYPGNDPETSDDPYSVTGGYIDAGNYPATRTFTFGLKVGF